MDGRTLPVRRFKDQILEKVQGNPVTLIYGETGSGKSSQVPQILEEGGLGPILCTQPRRLAVVAVSQRVAQERQTTLGEDVGYHIGQKNLSTSKSRIVFATAGILLEELRANGEKVFSRYRVIVLDEVHERSIESDLVLACAKQLLLRSVNARLVLMSATADFQRYSTYFSELGQGEKVQRIAIADPNVFLRKQLFDTRVKYIEQAVGELGQQRSHIEVVENFNRKEASPSPLSNAKIDQESHKLVRDLVLYIHSSETDLSKSILIFLPTYRCLENQWTLLQGCRQRLQIFVLHSSIDMNLCLKAMVAQESRYRKVVLATNIAESSVTMPGVSFVVDLCRNLELCWLTTENRHMPRIVWVSQSQADQRKGRTGRTCDGVVYRLVPRKSYTEFAKYETPAVQLLSLRKQVLMLSCASHKALNDPQVLFSRVMDPPEAATVAKALSYLVQINAITLSEKNHRQIYTPTTYGRLLVTLPLSLEAAIMVIRGGKLGILREGLILFALMDAAPLPINRPFGAVSLHQKFLESYSPPDEDTSESYSAHPSMDKAYLANLFAFEFWQRTFKDVERLHAIVHYAERVKVEGPLEADFCPAGGTVEGPSAEMESEWCRRHHLLQSALHAIDETVNVTLENLHTFLPAFLEDNLGPPSYFTANGSFHECEVSSASTPVPLGPEGLVLSEESAIMSPHGGTAEECNSTPFVHPRAIHSDGTLTKLKSLLQERSADRSQAQASEAEEERFGGSQYGNESSNGRSPEDTWNRDSPQETVAKNGFSHEYRNGHGVQEEGFPYPSSLRNSTDNDLAFSQGHYGEGHLRNCRTDSSSRIGSFGTHNFSVQSTTSDESRSRTTSADWATLQELSTSEFPELQTKDGEESKQLHKNGKSCIFYQNGSCFRGESCHFVHTGPSEPARSANTKTPTCRFFTSPQGCRNGDRCVFLHTRQDAMRTNLPVDDGPLEFLSTTATEQGMERLRELYRTADSDHQILLLGEGDFSFSMALAKVIDQPNRILATSYDTEATAVAKFPVVSLRLNVLRSTCKAHVFFGIDSTKVGAYLDRAVRAEGSVRGKGERRKGDGKVFRAREAPVLPWKKVGKVVWNFPFLGSDEDSEGHQGLFANFFGSLSLPFLMGLTEAKVVLTLCNDQFSRWKVERMARNAFFFLQEVAPFASEAFPGYEPVRNSSVGEFRMDRPLSYTFIWHRPSECGDSRQLVLEALK